LVANTQRCHPCGAPWWSSWPWTLPCGSRTALMMCSYSTVAF